MIPKAIKLFFVVFLMILIPKYLVAYGPTDFLFFCNIALFLTCYGVLTESSLPISMAAVGILLPQTFWILDFFGTMVGFPINGLTSYMFDPRLPIGTRLLSLYHMWLPLLLVYLLFLVRYDRRAGKAWVAVAWVLYVICFFFTPPPPADPEFPGMPVNINNVFGITADVCQTWTTPGRYFILWVFGTTLFIFLPTHFLLAFLFPPKKVLDAPHQSNLPRGIS